jgi:hypothetical protein
MTPATRLPPSLMLMALIVAWARIALTSSVTSAVPLASPLLVTVIE